MFNIPRFVVHDQISAQIQIDDNLSIQENKILNKALIFVDNFEDEEQESSLIQKICMAINFIDYEIKVLNNFNPETAFLNRELSFKIVMEFNRSSSSTNILKNEDSVFVKTFSVGQLIQNQNLKLDLWNSLKKINS